MSERIRNLNSPEGNRDLYTDRAPLADVLDPAMPVNETLDPAVPVDELDVQGIRRTSRLLARARSTT
jgi:hypothetical protein